MQEGQILLIVVLVMTIALTIGLSLATRTITDIRTTTEEENSQRAFSAAEAGIEKALKSTTGTTGDFVNNTSFDTSVATVSGVSILLNNGNPIFKDDAADVWLSTYPGYTNTWSGDITIYWGSASDTCTTSEETNTMAALDIVVLNGTRASPQAAHFPVDPCAARSSINNFETIPSGGGTINNKQFAYRKTVTVASGLIMRIVPIYAATPIAVRGCNATNGNCRMLPSQARVITSVGTADTTQRKLVVLQENPKIPVHMFPFILFSPR